jgi:hypothetical protein
VEIVIPVESGDVVWELGQERDIARWTPINRATVAPLE